MSLRVMYASGPGDVVQAHRDWSRGEPCAREVSVTFSSQIEDALAPLACKLHVLSNYDRADFLAAGDWTFENRPDRLRGARGLVFHAVQAGRGLALVARSLRFRADVVLVDSGRAHWFSLAPLRLAGVKVIPIVHNAFWPVARPPSSAAQRAIGWLDRAFWRLLPSATLVVSPECERQVRELSGSSAAPVFQVRAQFLPEYFDAIPHPRWDERPFRVMFAGRVEANKGVFDLVEMAEALARRLPGHFAWEVCGDGSALDELRRAVRNRALGPSFQVRGRLDRAAMAEAYGRSHAVVIPTRSSLSEAFAMVAAESVLAGRPFVTSRAVPALEVLREAAVEAEPDAVESYVSALSALASDRELYAAKVRACPGLRRQFLDRSYGLAAGVERALRAARVI